MSAFRPFSGELSSAEREAEFRAWSRDDHAMRARRALRVAAALMAIFAILDVGYHGLGGVGLGLASLRVTWSIAALVVAARASLLSDRVLAALSFAAMSVVLTSVAFRPPGVQPHTLSVAAVILAVYLLMPLRFRDALAIGAAGTLGYLALATRGELRMVPLAAVAAGYVVVNAIGFTGHAWASRVSRSEFLRVHEAEEAHAERLAFLASTSHELRAPLHGIVACAELLSGTNLDDEQRELVALIRSSTTAMSGLLEEAVHQVRGGDELPSIAPSSLDLRVFLEEIAALLRARASTHGVTVLARCADSVPRLVRADAGRLRQVVLNFGENALAHGARSRIELAIDAARRDDRVVVDLSVIDDGPGVPREVRDAILRPFVQAGPALSRPRGMGLGLAICDRMARAMGATISIEDAPGGGAWFRFRVPLQESEMSVARDERAPALRTLELLLVDDEAVHRRLMSLLLEREGHQVTVATTGEAAIEATTARRFHAVLMDLRLPRMDGVAAMRRIRAGDDAPPVIVMSAHAALADHDRLIAEGFRAVLSKPVDMEQLRATLAGVPVPTLAARAPEVIDEARLAMHAELLGAARMRELIELFVTSTTPVLDALALAAEHGERAQIADLAHRLAGAADSMALARCAREASLLETAARGQDVVSADAVANLRSIHALSCDSARAWAVQH